MSEMNVMFTRKPSYDLWTEQQNMNTYSFMLLINLCFYGFFSWFAIISVSSAP